MDNVNRMCHNQKLRLLFFVEDIPDVKIHEGLDGSRINLDTLSLGSLKYLEMAVHTIIRQKNI
jgi:hypothetical protein